MTSGKQPDAPKADAEPGGSAPPSSGPLKNDPDDSNNPNDEIEKFREKLRPEPM